MKVGNSRRKSVRMHQIDVASKEKQDAGLRLRLEGKSYREIAAELGYSSPSGIFVLLQNAIKEIAREAAEQVITIECARLDAMHNGIWPAAKNGDPKAIETVLKIQDRRSKFLGLDAPTKTKHEVAIGDGEVTPAEAARLVRAQFNSPVEAPGPKEDTGIEVSAPSDNDNSDGGDETSE